MSCSDRRRRISPLVKVVLVHIYYQQPGGEDQVFAAEGALLEAHGHRVDCYTVHNDAVEKLGRLEASRCSSRLRCDHLSSPVRVSF